MEGFLNLRRSFLEALVVGLLATSALFLPPLELAARANLGLYDLWSRLTPTSAPDGVLLVRLDDPDTLMPLVTAAHEQHAKLLVTTLPHPPSALVAAAALGPVDLPVGSTRLRRTEWPRGGHLLFEPDLDGVVRRDRALLDDSAVMPSLALYAAEQAADPPQASSWNAARGGEPLEPSPRWIRFYAGHPFPEVTAREALREPGALRGKIVIAGRAARERETPVGLLTTRELVAQTLVGYRDGLQIDGGVLGSVLAWSAAVVLLGLLAARPFRTRTATLGFAAASALAFVLSAALAFTLAGLWLPIAGPVALVLLTGTVLARRHPAAEPEAVTDQGLVAARRAAAGNDLKGAWRLYRQLPPSTTLLPELYDLAVALEESGLEREAADFYHRVAQVDGGFRDVAKRLVACGHDARSPEPTPEVSAMPTTLGRYRLLEPIGRGAMGYVYLGRDPKINRIVAVKAIDLALEFDAAELESASDRFLREAETAGRLSHPNIVTIFDVGEADGFAYIAMEYLKGRHLSEFSAPGDLASRIHGARLAGPNRRCTGLCARTERGAQGYQARQYYV